MALRDPSKRPRGARSSPVLLSRSPARLHHGQGLIRPARLLLVGCSGRGKQAQAAACIKILRLPSSSPWTSKELLGPACLAGVGER